MFKVYKTPEFKKAVRFYLEGMKGNKKHFYIAMSSAVLWCFLVVLHPYIIKRVVDDGIVTGNTRILVILLSSLIVIGYTRAISIGTRRYYGMSVSYNVEAGIRNNIFSHMQKLAFKYHDKVPTGELMARASSDASQVRLAYAIAPLASSNLFLLFILSITLLSISLPLGSVVLLSIPAVLWVGAKFAEKAMKVSLRVKEAEATMTTEVEEQLGGIRVVKAFGNENIASNKVDQAIDNIYEKSLDYLDLRTRFVPIFELIPMIITLFVLVLGGFLSVNGYITLGDFIAFNQYVFLLMWPLRITAWFLSEIPASVSAANRILELLNEKPAIVNNENVEKLPEGGNGTITFNKVNFKYGNEKIFDDLSFSIDGKKTVAIVGSTGSGKSTLGYLIPRLYEINSGEIQIDGIDINNLNLSELRNNVSLAFQESFLFSNSAKENIAIGLKDATQEEIENAANVARAHDFISELPEAYETTVGERGYGLSGGQRQRIAIARTLLSRPSLLIMDEATSALDYNTERRVCENIRKECKNSTVFFITHRLNTIKNSDNILLLHDGNLCEKGTHDELMMKQERYYALYRQQEAL